MDDGAARAIGRDGRSLLAIGIQVIEGDFQKGDVVSICDPCGVELARGLTNYHSDEILLIKGLRSTRIAEVLGQCPYEEVVHRNNMTITMRQDLSGF